MDLRNNALASSSEAWSPEPPLYAVGEPLRPSGDLWPGDYAETWRRIASGQYTVLESRTTLQRAHLVLSKAEARRAPRARDIAILEQILLGERPKCMAMDLKRSPSTVNVAVKRAFRDIGLDLLPSRLPLALAILVHHAHRRPAVEMTRELTADPSRVMLSARLAQLDATLSPAVLDVVLKHAQGCTHAEIAARRSTSPRTVANQLAMAFDRLRVSGRSELIEYLVVTASAPLG